MEELDLVTVLQSSVNVIQENPPMVTSFLRALQRSFVFTSEAVLALIKVKFVIKERCKFFTI